MRTAVRHSILLLLLAVSARESSADWVNLQDGRREQCIVLETNASGVQIERHGGRFTLKPTDIKSIDRQTAADNDVLRAEYALAEGMGDPNAFLAAVRTYAKAHAGGASVETLCNSLVPMLSDLTASGTVFKGPAVDELAELLVKLSPNVPQTVPPEFYYDASLFLSRAGRTAESLDIFMKAPAELHAAHPEWRAELSKRVVADIQSLIANDDAETAIKRLTLLGQIDPDRGETSRPWAMLNKADLLSDSGKYEEAVALYVEEVAKEYPEIARNRIVNLLDEALADAKVTGDFHAAVRLTTGPTVELLGRPAAETLRGQAYREWGLWALDRKDFDAAREALNQHYIFMPSEEKKLLSLVDYRERSAALTAADVEGHYELGVFCLQAGLTEQAKEQFRQVAPDSDWGMLAQKYLDDLETQRLEALLAQAHDLKEKGQFLEARDKVAIVIQESKDPELTDLAKRSLSVITTSMEYIHKRAPIEAEVLWQNAERCLLPGEAQRCLELLNEILREYPDTPAAKRAAERRAYLLKQGFRDTARRTPLAEQTAKAPATSQPERPFVDPVRLNEELQRLQKSIETVAAE